MEVTTKADTRKASKGQELQKMSLVGMPWKGVGRVLFED